MNQPARRRRKSAPFNPAHDRRTTDLLRNAQVSPIEIDDPLEAGGKLIVMRSTRNDPIANLHARHHIDEAQYQGGRAFQNDFETIERGAKAVDPSAPYVDCSRGPQRVSDEYSRAFSRLNRANKALGIDGSALAFDVLIRGLTYRQIAEARGLEGRRYEEYFGMSFNVYLHRLSYIYGFATEQTGRGRIKVSPGFIG